MSAEAELLSRLLGAQVSRLERVGRGRNSRVYRVSCESRDYAAKFYFQKTADGRDRLEVEYGAVGFLWTAGVRRIARPIVADAAQQVALYEFIEGDCVDPHSASVRDIEQVVEFAAELKAIAAQSPSAELGDAAEAFFSIDGVVRNVEARLERLEGLEVPGRSYDAMRHFLRAQFRPRFAALEKRARSGGAAGTDLDPRHRTLSPSDFGFHNTIRKHDGSLVFLDLEYFGWDDPAKLLCDLLLHPMMALPYEQRTRLAAGLDAIFRADPGWRPRAEALYPLFGLKWCMIMLNEFLPSHIARNRFTERDAAQTDEIQARQLRAAGAMLERIKGETDRFPYWSAATA